MCTTTKVNYALLRCMEAGRDIEVELPDYKALITARETVYKFAKTYGGKYETQKVSENPWRMCIRCVARAEAQP